MIRFLTDLFKNKEIRTRIIFTLAMLFIYMLGAVIPTPNVDHVKLASSVSSNSILEMMSVLGGGQLQSFSVFSLGVGPYITASIIVQLLSMEIKGNYKWIKSHVTLVSCWVIFKPSH